MKQRPWEGFSASPACTVPTWPDAQETDAAQWNGDVARLSRNSRGPPPRLAHWSRSRTAHVAHTQTMTAAVAAPAVRRHDSDRCGPTWMKRSWGTSPADMEGQGRVTALWLHADDDLGSGRRQQCWLPASSLWREASRSGLNGGGRVGRLRCRGLGRSEVRRQWGRRSASVALGGDLRTGRGITE
jgi:hypothetical protein